MYKPGQLVTKQIHGVNHVLRIAKCKSWEYPCGKCIVDAIDTYSLVKQRKVCEWCMKNLSAKMYLKRA